MKNSKQYAAKIRTFFRQARQAYPKPDPAAFADPLEALLYGLLAEHMSDSDAGAAVKRIKDWFVDLNDLRVSRPEEIAEVLGGDSPQNRELAMTLTRALRAVYDKYHLLSLAPLKKLGKKNARQVLAKLDGVSEFASEFCMLAALGAHAVPLNRKMLDYLTSEELVDPQADPAEINGFLTRQIALRDAWQFYCLLRKATESPARLKRKSTRRAAAKKKK